MVHDSILNNIGLAGVEMTKKKLGFLSPKERVEISKKAIESFSIKTNGPNQQLAGLSGGNRQKVNLSRWIIQNKEILILDCPTRGVDIGVKSYIYQTMLAAKRDGVSMVLITDELPEVIGMCDTLKIVKDGEIVKTIERGPELSEESIIEVMV
jgi:ribose transport system ATP-binding protein